MKFDLKTVNDVFFRACGAGDERVMQTRDPAGKGQPITGRQLYQRVRAFAKALSGWGVSDGDRVALRRQPMKPMRGDLLALFDRGELAKYLTEEELPAAGEETS